MDGIGEQRQVAVDVGIDEAGRDHQAGGVDAFPGFGLAEPADGGDAFADDAQSPRNHGLPLPSTTRPPVMR